MVNFPLLGALEWGLSQVLGPVFTDMNVKPIPQHPIPHSGEGSGFSLISTGPSTADLCTNTAQTSPLPTQLPELGLFLQNLPVAPLCLSVASEIMEKIMGNR